MKKIILVALLMLPACEAIHGPADIQVLRESRPMGDTKELTIDLKYDVGQLEISRSSDNNLFSFDLQYDRNRYDPTFKFDEGSRASMRLNLDSHSGGFGSNSGRDNELTLHLTDRVPLDLNLT